MKFKVVITNIEEFLKESYDYSLILVGLDEGEYIPDNWLELTTVDIDVSIDREQVNKCALDVLAKEEQEFNLKVHEKNLRFEKRRSELQALPNLSRGRHD